VRERGREIFEIHHLQITINQLQLTFTIYPLPFTLIRYKENI